ncbi:MAG: Uncharacterized protein XD43_1167 [Thermococcales archaeon 44_46]|jgi:hypothetical protein|uniref:hypothetical protein n=1 Tax=unclassified Thermococcus TaxID=2627626 RepID=UPI0005B25BB5|nr:MULTISPECIES: hypothetical protein [unclassified Thermococcus]KUJ99171.1 MAG: Uncharacterized protein XD43_1167 [Thermococcales archaeon 44_46]MPW38839.1 hypothetical protein [Thermococcus sp. 101 C5]HIH73125.1 hypothetical protein [Thermococcaceae archaeon]
MDPLELMTAASKRISPTFLNHEIGSDIEIVLYHLIKRLREDYEDFLIVSFQDAYASILKYLKSVYEDADEVFERVKIISVNPFIEEELNPDLSIKTKDAEIIIGRISGYLKTKNNTLTLVLGLDLYGVKYPDELVVILPALIRVLSKGDNNVLVTFDVKIFSEDILEIVNSFALNLFKFGIEVKENEIKRKFTVIRSPFLEYNLRSWYYTVTPTKIVFFPVTAEV